MTFTRNATTQGIKIYEVGGAIRDGLLGLQSKDRDFAVIGESFDAMREFIQINGGQIFLETPAFQTIRAKMPELGAADFVLGRHESGYTDGRHPDHVSVASDIVQELSRRDFTMNAIARDCEDDTLIDPFGGQADIAAKVIRCVGDTEKRFNEDRLRMLRAIRFAITKGFALDAEISSHLFFHGGDLQGVSAERIREELLKCFEANTLETLRLLNSKPDLRDACFAGGKLFLKPTIRG